MSAHEDQHFAETRPARLIAVGNRINLSAATTEQSFINELERIVGLVVPSLATDRPNLVVLGEMLGLPLALAGRRGYLSRHMHTSSVAISMLSLGYARRMLYYRRQYPGISLVRSLLLSLSDAMYRPFTSALSRLAALHNIYLSASTIVPHVQCSTSRTDINRLGKRYASKVYLPDGPGVYNTGFLWGPDGNLIGTTDKVFLTESEKTTLDLTAGNLEDVRVFETEMGKIGMAINLDAFTPEYVRRLDDLGACIVLQNDANDQPWASPSKTADWHPQEWLNAVLGCLQDDYPHLYFNVCSMQVGNFFDVTFDGQSTITMKSERGPDPCCNLIGNDGFVHTVTGEVMKGDILAVSPWIVDDPMKATPDMPLADRRATLMQAGKQLLPGGTRANQYPESVIWADVDVPVI